MDAETVVRGLGFRIDHTMVPVADLDRSVRFYTRLLGMKPMRRRIDGTRKVEVGHVGYGDQPTLELTKDISENAPQSVRPTGIHVAIHVSDLQRLCRVLEDEKVDFLQPLQGLGGRRLVAWIRDPDGNALELVEVRAA